MKSVYLSVVLLIVALSGYSQDKTSCKRHSAEFYPISLTYNKGFFVGHSFKYAYSLSPSLYTEITSEGVLIPILDARSDNFPPNQKFPLFNQSKLFVGYNFKNGSMNDENLSKYSFGTRLGYHYLQHGSENGEYWQHDTTVIGEEVGITGFKTHSVLLGIQYKYDKPVKKSNSKIQCQSHRISLDYIFGVSILLTGNVVKGGNSTVIGIENTFKIKRNGINLAYNYSHSLTSKLNFHTGIEVLWAPFIDYYPNDAFFVPRGGEWISPFFPTLKVGLGI